MTELLAEIELHSRALPDYIQQEVLDFIKFKENKLETEQRENNEVYILSESALPEWNNDEEESAWKSFQ